MAYRRWLAACAIGAALSLEGCFAAGVGGPPGPAEAGPGEVPFELGGQGGMAVVVPVRVNGQGPFDFVVDTGATLTCVDATLADQLRLADKPGAIGQGAGISGAGALRVVEIDSIEVGTAGASDLTAAVVDLGNIRGAGLDVHGLIGLNYLKNYRVTFDFERRMLELRDPDAPPAPATTPGPR